MTSELNVSTPVWFLVLRVGKLVCGLPLATVIEVMRCLPVVAISNLPRFVMGVSRIRANRVPVVNLRELFEPGCAQATPTRLVTIRVGARVVALAVDAVIGARELDRALLEKVPPLLKSAPPNVLAAIGFLDREFLMALDGSRMLPEDILARIPADDDQRKAC